MGVTAMRPSMAPSLITVVPIAVAPVRIASAPGAAVIEPLLRSVP